MAVFLSYHSSRLDTVEHVANYLARHGIDSWYAPRNIPPGAIWDEAIFAAIRECDALVLLFDSSADLSINVKREITLADRTKTPIRWLRLEAIEPNNLGYYLFATQWIDWLDKRDDALEELVRSLPRTDRPEPEPSRAAIESEPSVPAETGLPEYVVWQPRTLTPVADATRDQIVDGLVEIVTAEGPIMTQRALRSYVKASGGQRVGKSIEDTLNEAIEDAIRTERLAQTKDHPRLRSRSLYLPGTPEAVPRTLGPRIIAEVPRSEIQELVRRLAVPTPSAIPRAVADQLGITRLTDEALGHITAALKPASDESDALPMSLAESNDDETRTSRLKDVLAEATGLPTEKYDEGAVGAVVMFPGHRVVSVQRANLWMKDDTVLLTLTPAELAAQYNRVYSPATAESLIALNQLGWMINPNFHIAYRFAQPKMRWYPPHYLPGVDYVRQWVDDLKDKRAGGRTNEQLRSDEFRRWLVERCYADESDLPSLDAWLDARPAGTQLHIRPSVELRRTWTLADAIALDDEDQLVSQVSDAIDEVLGTLDEPDLAQLQMIR